MKRVAILLALVTTGCILKPDKLGLTGDAGGSDHGDGGGSGSDGHDAGVGANMIPRVVGKAYWQDDPNGGSMDMQQYTYKVVRSGPVEDGELLLLFGNIDNTPIVNPPTGWSPVFGQKSFGADTQTYFAFERIAANEPGEYTGTYTHDDSSTVTSGAVTMLLVAIKGASSSFSANPKNDACVTSTAVCGTVGTVDMTSPGVPTSDGNVVLYAAGADWFIPNTDVTFATPTGFTLLDAFTDRDTTELRWTTMLVAYRSQDTSAATPIDGSMTSQGNRGQPWTIAIPLAPNP